MHMQFCIDCHYAYAIFHYQKVMDVKFRKFCSVVCMDDKHHCKVGEPGHRDVAVDKGKCVLVSEDKVFAVSDHDFTKFSIIPSVTMILDMPDTVDRSFYRGQLYVGVKGLIFHFMMLQICSIFCNQAISISLPCVYIQMRALITGLHI